MTQVEVLELAWQDLWEARDWYESQLSGLGDEFLMEVRRVIGHVAEAPRQFPWHRKPMRRAMTNRFPYGIFFCEHDERLYVLAVLHLHRSPRTPGRRLRAFKKTLRK